MASTSKDQRSRLAHDRPRASLIYFDSRMRRRRRMIYRDRVEAGKRLASRLTDYANRSDVVVLALPRGGVPVAFEVAEALRAPLDIFLVRKLGVPGHEELAMGAIATGGVRVLNEDVVD